MGTSSRSHPCPPQTLLVPLESSDISGDDCVYLRTTIKDHSPPNKPESYVVNPGANDSCVSQPLTPTPKKVTEQSTNSSLNQFSTLKVIYINCQSIQSAEKQARLHAFLEFYKPDIVIGTESRLHKDIIDCESCVTSITLNWTGRKIGQLFNQIAQTGNHI